MPYRPLVRSEHSAVTAANPDGWCKPRHADSLVEDSDLQRRVDGLIVRNRMFAASIVASNKIERAPPIRIWDNEVQVSSPTRVIASMLYSFSMYLYRRMSYSRCAWVTRDEVDALDQP